MTVPYQSGYNTALEAAGLEKTAIMASLRHGYKALKGALGAPIRSLRGNPQVAGLFRPQRMKAVQHGDDLLDSLRRTGVRTQRARVKSPASMAAKGLTEVPDDLLGMQTYGKSPQDVQKTMDALREVGVEDIAASAKTKPGYHGINIKGQYQGTPVEMQVAPSPMSLIGNQLEHSLVYKQLTESPDANWLDNLIGTKVAPKLVNWDALGPVDPSWINEHLDELAAMGVEV